MPALPPAPERAFGAEDPKRPGTGVWGLGAGVASATSVVGASAGGGGMAEVPPEPLDVDPPEPLEPLGVDPRELPPVPVPGGTGGGCLVDPLVGLVDGVGEPLADGDADGVDIAVVSTGLLLVALGFGVAGLPVARGAVGGVTRRVVTNRSSPAVGMSRRGSASMMARAFGDPNVGWGVGLGATSAAASPPRSGNGRMALELTGPPARLTLTNPP